jgi:hypothetical protein
MSRGPGRIERAVETALSSANRSYSIDELAGLAYPDVGNVEKKHRVAVLRTLGNIDNRILLWLFITYERRGRYFVTNGCNVRSYAHGLQSWWNAERSLDEIENILADDEIQAEMEPGGLWWTEVEINTMHYTINQIRQAANLPRIRTPKDAMEKTSSGELENTLTRQLGDLYVHRAWLAQSYQKVRLLGRFEQPGTPVFNFAMELRAGMKPSSEDHLLKMERRRWIGDTVIGATNDV